jgi:hypothetical protein
MSIFNKEVKNNNNDKFKKLSLELRKNLQRRKKNVETPSILKKQEIISVEDRESN